MPWLDVIWDDGPGGNVEHIAENDVSPEEAAYVLRNPELEEISESSGRPMRIGWTEADRYLAVVFEWIDPITVYPITAFDKEPQHD